MEFYFNDTRSFESTTDDAFSLSSVPPPFRASFSKEGLAGRASPGHDLGYHTLLARESPPPSPAVSRTFRWAEAAMGHYPPPAVARTSVARTCSRPLLKTSITPYLESTPLRSRAKVKKASLFDLLSDETVLKIFSYLSSNHLCVCARVCRRWYFLAWEPQLWTSVCLSNDKIQVDRGLKTLFRLLGRDSPGMCLSVEKISLSGCDKLTDKGLATIAKRCPDLKSLEIRGCNLVSNVGIAEVVTRCTNILKLDLTGCHLVTTIEPKYERSDHLLERAATVHLRPQGIHYQYQFFLQFLDLTDCHGLDDFGLKAIVRNSPQLSHLYLRRCVQITDCGVKAIASYCIMLRELSISDCILVTDFGMYELAKLGANLRYLSVAKCDQISDAGIKQICRHCYKLRYLNVRGCEAVSDQSMEVLARSCSRLRALDVGKCDISDNGLRLLSENCPNLRKLSVKSCDVISDQGIQAIAFFCRGLQQLNIQDCNITLEGYRTVKKFCKKCIIEHTSPGFY